MKYSEKKNAKQRQQTNRKTELKKSTTTTTNNTLTITRKLFSLAYFTQKILSGHCSDDIYKEALHPLPPWHHMTNMKEGVKTSAGVIKE